MTIHAVLVCFAIAAAGTNESDRAPRDRDAGRGSGPTTPMKPTTTAGMGRERRLRTTVPIGHAVSCRDRSHQFPSAQHSPSSNSCCLPQPGILPQVRYPAKTANIFRSTSCSRSPRWCVTASLINHKSRSPVADLAFFYLLASPE